MRRELSEVTITNEAFIPMILRLFPRLEHPFDKAGYKKIVELEYNEIKEKFNLLPKMTQPGATGDREKEFTRFLQGMVRTASFYKKNNGAENRVWTSDFLPLDLCKRSGEPRKPDILVLSPSAINAIFRGNGGRLDMKHVDLILEIRTDTVTTWTELLDEVTEKAISIFRSQLNRRFVVSLSMIQTMCILSLYNRSGIIHSMPFDINKQPSFFIYILLSITFGPPSLIGYDPSFNTGYGYGDCSISVDRKVYKLERTCWQSYSIDGRGTQCFVVSAEGTYHVVKDVWIVTKRKPTELYFYKKANGARVRNILYLEAFENVIVNSKNDCCEIGDGEIKLTSRLHRRYLFRDYCVPLWYFQSQLELFSAFIDYLIGS